MPDVRIARNAEVAGVDAGEVERLTQRATLSTYYADGLTSRQVAANQRIPILARDVFFEAATSERQHLAAAFVAARLAGFMIATRHRADDLELDWLMVDPKRHGSGIAASLMTEGLHWLGPDRPIWLTVLKHNRRAIGFYQKFGFEVDELIELNREVPTWIMRRPAIALSNQFFHSCG